MYASLRFAILATALLILPGLTGAVAADDPQVKDTAEPALDADEAKAKALQWIDDYRKQQVLFHDEDVLKLRKKLEAETAAEVATWWTDTAGIRQALDDPEWKETRDWLRKFLKVQAIYSDEQIEELRGEAKEAASEYSTADFKALLAKIESMRSKLVRGAANSRALRAQQVAVAHAFHAKEAAARDAARRAAAAATPQSPATRPVQPRPPRSPQPPLIDSLDVARYQIIRGLWRWSIR